jgi:hypothetical protein
MGIIGAGALLGLLFLRIPVARAAWEEISRYLSLQGKPERASARASLLVTGVGGPHLFAPLGAMPCGLKTTGCKNRTNQMRLC